MEPDPRISRGSLRRIHPQIVEVTLSSGLRAAVAAEEPKISVGVHPCERLQAATRRIAGSRRAFHSVNSGLRDEVRTRNPSPLAVAVLPQIIECTGLSGQVHTVAAK